MRTRSYGVSRQQDTRSILAAAIRPQPDAYKNNL